MAIHLLRYDYDAQQDQLPVLNELNLDLHLSGDFGNAEVFSPNETPHADVKVLEGMHHLALKNLPLYSIVLLKK